MTHRAIAVSLLLGAFAPLRSQSAVYRSPAADVFVATINPYRMYWVRGADTIGGPVKELTLETQSWKAADGALQVVVAQQTLDASRRTTTDTFTLEENGRVAMINRKPPGIHGRVDFLLRLPSTPLRPALS